jgi:type II secretory pathway component GspD/PulD (secretin)
MDGQVYLGPAVDSAVSYEAGSVTNTVVFDDSQRNYNPSNLQFPPSSIGPFSFDINQPAHTAYETIAAKAGISVVFDSGFLPTPATIRMKLNDIDIFTALDRMAMASRTFWVPFGNQAIFVTADNSTMRRDYDPTKLEVIPVTGAKTAQQLNDVMNAVRQNLNVTTMTAFPRTNSLILRDTPAKVALVEKLIAVLDGQLNGQINGAAAVVPTASFEAGTVTDGSVFDGSHRNINPSSSQLQPTSTGPFSFDINHPIPSAFETIAAKAGLTVVFDADYVPAPATIRMKLDAIDIYTALDRIATVSHTFWLPFGNQAIFVTADNSTKHRDYDLTKVEVIQLSVVKSTQELNDVMNAVRQNLNMTTMVANSATNSLIFRETPAKAARAEKLIAALDGQMKGQINGAASAVRTSSFEAGAIGNGYILDGSRNMNSSSPQLQPAPVGQFSFNINEPARSAYESIAAKAGLSVVFDRDYLPPADTPIALKLNDVDIYSALNRMSMVSHTFWLPLGKQTIFVSDNTVAKHRNFDPVKLEVIPLTSAKTVQELDSATNAVRGVLNITSVAANPRTNSLVLLDTPDKVSTAEKLVTELDALNRTASGTPPQSVPILSIDMESQGTLFDVQNAGLRRYLMPAGSRLQPTTRLPFSLHMNEDSRRAYEIVGETAGLTVIFDPNFVPGPPTAFRLDNLDIFHALDLLSMQTRNIWDVVDSKTIIVAAEGTATLQLQKDSPIHKTFHLTNATMPQDFDNLSILLRSMLNILDLKVDRVANTIEVTGKSATVALAEKLIAAMDKPAPAR